MDEATRAIVALLLDYPPSWAYGAMFEGVPCRVWIGRVDKDGYGMTYNPVTGYPYRTARMAWEVVNGPIPPGLTVDHRCRVRPCYEVAHLRLLTHGENSRDGARRSASAEHCPYGHEYTPENTRVRIRPQGWISRSCKTCHREQERARRRR